MSSHGDVYLVLLAVHRPVHRALKAIGFMDVGNILALRFTCPSNAGTTCQVSMNARFQ